MSESSEYNHGSYQQRLGYDPFPRQLLDVAKVAQLGGLIGLGVLLIWGFIGDHGHAFRSLLLAFHFFLIISLGCLGFVMISHLTGGGWGAVIRRFGEAAFMNLPLMFVIFLVLTLGYKYLFPWAHIEDFKPDKVAYEVLGKGAMLYSWWTFTLRTTLYFAVWYILATSLRGGSLKLDRGPDLVLRRKMRKISGGGMVLFFATTTGYSLDFMQARETCWYSSVHGFITAIGIGIAGMGFLSLCVCYFARTRPIKDVLIPQHTNDLGNILLALVILFMYCNFAQYLIQWNGNEPEDYYYYTYRGLGTIYNGWRYFTLFLLIFEFFAPFFLLLMKGLKRNIKTFSQIAGMLLFMQLMYSCWLYCPSMAHRVGFGGSTIDPSGGHFYLTDLFALVGVGGLWLSSFIKRLSSQPLLALNVADQPEIVTHGTPAHA